MRLAMLSFVTPWMAWGAIAAIGLPVLAHLLSRTRYREAVFPAVRFVQLAVAATSRIETPRHRLLMLLRALMLILLVLAFMRPQWTHDAQAVEADRGMALVLLVDASASMQRSRDGVTLYGRAIREAQSLLKQMDPARDVAAVIRVDHAPTSLLPEATARFELLTQRLSQTLPGDSHAGWPGAMAAAGPLLADESRTVRLVTLSDQQGEPPTLDPTLRFSTAMIEHVPILGPTAILGTTEPRPP